MDGRFYYVSVLASLVLQLNFLRGEEPNKEQSPECPKKTFPCFLDCCEKGEAFCNKREQRCTYCEDKYQLCGTDLMPVECLLYCHKRQATYHHACVSKAEIAAIGTAPAVFLFSAILLICLYLKKKPPGQWPPFFQALLLRQDSMDKEDNISTSTSDSSLLALSAHDYDGLANDHQDNNPLLADNNLRYTDNSPAGVLGEHGDVGEGEREGPTNGTPVWDGRGGDRTPLPEAGTASQVSAAKDTARPSNVSAGNPAQNGGGPSRLDSGAPDFNAGDTRSNGEGRSPGPSRSTESFHGPNFAHMYPTSEDSKLALGLSMADPSKLYTTEGN